MGAVKMVSLLSIGDEDDEVCREALDRVVRMIRLKKIRGNRECGEM